MAHALMLDQFASALPGVDGFTVRERLATFLVSEPEFVDPQVQALHDVLGVSRAG